MMMSHKSLVLGLLALLFFNKVYALEKVKLYLKWKHQFQFAGYYIAKEKGYYKSAGLDVEIIERDKRWTPQEMVANQPGHYGISDSTIIIEYLKGSPNIVVSSLFQHSPLVLATRKEDQIMGPESLVGKKVMYQKGIDDAVLKLMFKTVGLSENDIIHVPHSFNAEDLLSKKVDAISIYATNQPYLYKQLGQKIRMINPANYGIDLYNDILFTSQKEADQYPTRVRRFREATLRGWGYALYNTEEAIEIIQSKYNSKLSRDKLIFEANEMKKFVADDYIPLGQTRVDRLARIARIYGAKNVKSEKLKNIMFEHYLLKKKQEQNKLVLIIIGCLIFVGTIVLLLIYLNQKLKKAVTKQTHRLASIQESKDMFFANMTHELRTPLNAIVGSLTLLKDKSLKKGEREKFFDIIEVSSQNLLNLVNDLLDFSKLEKKELALHQEPVNFEHFMNKIVCYHKINAEKKGLVFELKLKNCRQKTFMLDRVRLAQVFNNLLSNAIKFTQHGHIKVHCEHSVVNENSSSINIKVIDSGRGIAEDKLEKVFLPYQQESNAIINQYGGTGLGLAICREIIKLFRGEIRALRNPEGGTIIDLHIHCQRALEPAKSEILIPTFQCVYPKLNILVAEDNKFNCLIIEKFFKKLNQEPIFVENGELALKKLVESKFDMVFLDNLMPVMTGLEAAKLIRSHSHDRIAKSFLVGQSASWGTGLDQECLLAGMDASISKPIKLEDLIQVIEIYLEKNPKLLNAA